MLAEGCPSYAGQLERVLAAAYQAMVSIMKSESWDRLIIGALGNPQGFLHAVFLSMKVSAPADADQGPRKAAIH